MASPSDDPASAGLRQAQTFPNRPPGGVSKLFANLPWEDLGSPDFDTVNQAARPILIVVLKRLLPDGRRQGTEFVARNPRRADRKPGSFKINLSTGQWADFAIDAKGGAKGGDVISLVAYLHDLPQHEAARRLARMLGLKVDGGRCG